jgi:hypothetical protein
VWSFIQKSSVRLSKQVVSGGVSLSIVLAQQVSGTRRCACSHAISDAVAQKGRSFEEAILVLIGVICVHPLSLSLSLL